MNDTYAGFWLRFVAIIIDGIIVGCIQFMILMPMLTMLGLGIASSADSMDMDDPGNALGMVGAVIAIVSAYGFLIVCVRLLYFTLMEASKFQGTLGKMALGIKVTDMNGGRLDFVKALLRNLCKIITDITLFIGYIMAGFTEKKQALHDMIAGTLVVKK